MPSLYLMDRQFEGVTFGLDEAIDNQEIQLLFHDSWYWLHYQFFSCRDCIRSESASAVRTHLYNLAAMIFHSFEDLPERLQQTDTQLRAMIAELVEIAEYTREFSIVLWIYGDETSHSYLQERLSELPTREQIERLIQLPHFVRMETERLQYRHDADKVALKRFRNEEASYNKRQKQLRKDQQRNPAQDC